MNGNQAGEFDRAHVERWLKTTRRYLLADRLDAPDGTRASQPVRRPQNVAGPNANSEDALRELRVDSRGAQLRFMSRVRGRLARLLRRARPRPECALQELALAFHAQVAFIARNPEVPRRMLRWWFEGGNGRVHRRIRKTIDCYVVRVSRILGRAQQQGEIGQAIEPRGAALLLVGLIQGFALRMSAGLQSPDRAIKEVQALFALYLVGIGAGAHP